MINSLKNMVSQIFYAPTNSVQAVTPKLTSNNPFENPYVYSSSSNNYAVNKPVKGGYFAGYYDGKPNIVGRRLFIMA